VLTPAEVLFALTAFAEIIPGILAVLAVPDKNSDEWRFHWRSPVRKNAITELAQEYRIFCK
jgi:hypothetical protein